jgi:tripartite-type tricarboxylate transporter receptor subunit TctC
MRKYLFALAAACCLACMNAHAQSDYPTKPITLIVPFAAGSGTDVLARTLTIAMSQEWARAQFVIDNRPGANGMIAAGLAAKAVGDGYTLFLTTNTTHSVNPYIYKNLPYDPIADFVAVGLAGETAPALLTASSSKVNSVKEMVDLARQKSGALNFAAINTSSLASTQLFQQRANIKGEIVNYKAATQALIDTSTGAIDFFFGDLASGGTFVRNGKLKALAVLSERRLPGFPQVPTMTEEGYPGVEIHIWIGMFAPKGTPALIVDRVNQVMVAALKRPEVVQALHSTAVEPRPTSPKEFATFVSDQLQRWGRLAKDFNLQAE